MKSTILKVVIFAIAFAYVEAAVVVYLRHLLGSTQPMVTKDEILLLLPGIAFLEPQTAIKIFTNTALLNVERAREAATLVMLASVALIAARKIKDQIAYFLLVFGVWDIFYYVFLRLTIGWPAKLSDLDVFFFLPTPLVGPVVVPLLISIVLITGSLLYLLRGKND